MLLIRTKNNFLKSLIPFISNNLNDSLIFYTKKIEYLEENNIPVIPTKQFSEFLNFVGIKVTSKVLIAPEKTEAEAGVQTILAQKGFDLLEFRGLLLDCIEGKANDLFFFSRIFILANGIIEIYLTNVSFLQLIKKIAKRQSLKKKRSYRRKKSKKFRFYVFKKKKFKLRKSRFLTIIEFWKMINFDDKIFKTTSFVGTLRSVYFKLIK